MKIIKQAYFEDLETTLTLKQDQRDGHYTVEQVFDGAVEKEFGYERHDQAFSCYAEHLHALKAQGELTSEVTA